VRSRADILGLDPSFYHKIDIHIQIPEGAIPKDGPSAGITLATALVSALTRKRIRNDLAMTGEITLRGRVLPIGGLRDKVLAAYRVGIRRIILPAENQKDTHEIPERIRAQIEFIPVARMEEVERAALLPAKPEDATTVAEESDVVPVAARGSGGNIPTPQRDEPSAPMAPPDLPDGDQSQAQMGKSAKKPKDEEK
jgi:ATP-dependent Lon protease